MSMVTFIKVIENNINGFIILSKEAVILDSIWKWKFKKIKGWWGQVFKQ